MYIFIFIFIIVLYENTSCILLYANYFSNLCTAEDDQKLNDRNVQILRRALR